MAQRLYDFLDVGKGPRLSDCIFVLSSKQEWKAYGVKMWRFGYASQLILSVGPSEWQQFSELKLESNGGLEALTSQTPSEKKHFFVRLDHQEAACSLIRSGRLSMHSEAKALAEYLRKNPISSLLVVSSPVHLRRVSLSFRRALRKRDVRLTFVAVPEQMPLPSRIWSEFRRYVLYLVCHL